MPITAYPTQSSLGQIHPTCYSLGGGQKKTIKIIPHLAFILVTDNYPRMKIKKKNNLVTKGITYLLITVLPLLCIIG